MTDSVGAGANTGGTALRRFGLAWTLDRDHAIWAVATLAAWAHTIDELRIGELVALPFAVANAAVVGTWSRMTTRSQAAISVGFGLFWGLTAIPYHVAPLIGGAVTWQNVSGLARVVAGVAMIALGVSIARRRRGGTPRDPPG
jgi:hypothetical protein